MNTPVERETERVGESEGGFSLLSLLIKGTIFCSALYGIETGKSLAEQKFDIWKKQVVKSSLNSEIANKSFIVDQKSGKAKLPTDMSREELFKALYLVTVENSELQGKLDNVRFTVEK